MAQGLPKYEVPPLDGGFWSRVWYKFLSSLWPPQGDASATFESGYVQYASDQGSNPLGVQASIHFEFGTKLPNPSGTPGPALLLGSNSPAWIISDQAYTVSDPGNLLGITAGETQPGSTQQGGELFLIAGASDKGLGGTLQAQGGTSASGNGGSAVLQGGNSTSGIPGDAFVVGGENGIQGANVHLIMTKLSGTSGVVRIRVNSTPLWDFYADGSIYCYLGGGFGTNGQKLTSQGPGQPVVWS